MRRGQAVRDLQRILRGLAHRKRRSGRAAQQLAQRFAFEQFTDEIRRAFVHAGIVNRQNVRMIQRRQGLCFLVEPPQPVRVRHEVLRQHLHRHVAIEPRVPRAKHFAHPAGADRGSDSVLVERGADHGNNVICRGGNATDSNERIRRL